MSRLRASDMVASFDSASVLHAGLAVALRGRPFRHLGHGAAAGAAIRIAGRMPWPLLRELYVRIGASEGVDPARLDEVDTGVVAQQTADACPRGRYPAMLVGRCSSNGALTQHAVLPRATERAMALDTSFALRHPADRPTTSGALHEPALVPGGFDGGFDGACKERRRRRVTLAVLGASAAVLGAVRRVATS